MADIVTILTTATLDTGPTQTMKANFLKKQRPLRISIAIGAGDTVVIEGKPATANDFEILHTFTTETPADVYVSKIWRARRTVDGGNDSVVKVENPTNQALTAHA